MNKKPSWWLCYLLFGTMIGLVWLVYRSAMSARMQEFAACAVVVVGFCSLGRWMRANHAAFEYEDWERQVCKRRDAPLTAVQKDYLWSIEQHRRAAVHQVRVVRRIEPAHPSRRS